MSDMNAARPRGETKATEPTTASGLAGKYITFRLAGEDYGLGILKVREIIGLMDITRVPGAPSFIRGVINLRGKVIPIVDLRVKFGITDASPVDRPVMVVVQVKTEDGTVTLGVLVDQVLEVRAILEAQIEPTPNFGARGTEVDYILGVAKAEKRVVFILDIDRVLTTAEITRVRGDAHAAVPPVSND
jgi:purine-binding chemotaxis protein CheW